MNLHDHINVISKVADKAGKEYQVEQVCLDCFCMQLFILSITINYCIIVLFYDLY